MEGFLLLVIFVVYGMAAYAFSQLRAEIRMLRVAIRHMADELDKHGVVTDRFATYIHELTDEEAA